MLQFIEELAFAASDPSLFKNISCYSLSERERSQGRAYAFKNISCYSLSFGSIHNERVAHIFKNISCYSLSIIKNIANNFEII